MLKHNTKQLSDGGKRSLFDHFILDLALIQDKGVLKNKINKRLIDLESVRIEKTHQDLEYLDMKHLFDLWIFADEIDDLEQFDCMISSLRGIS